MTFLAMPEGEDFSFVPELAAEAEFDGERAPEPPPDKWFDDNSELSIYRDRTIALLKRYGRMSVEVGRLPSLLGREFFSTRVSSYKVATFEDAVIFVHNVEQALEILDDFERKIIGWMVLQDSTQDEAAGLLGCGRRTLVRRLPEILDRLSGYFLEGGLLRRLPEPEAEPENSCQEGKSDENQLSSCEQDE